MKIYLPIAVLICIIAKSTPAVVEHGGPVPEEAQSEPALVRNLRAAVIPDVREELKRISKRFMEHVRDDFAYNYIVLALYKDFKNLPHEDIFNAMKLSWNDEHLLRRPNFLRWYDRDESSFDIVFKNLVASNSDAAAVVKIVNSGMLDSKINTRLLAFDLETHLLNSWIESEWSVRKAFKELKLNEITDETELFSNPAFVTWMRYAQLATAKDRTSVAWTDEMVNVLRNEENSKDFRLVSEENDAVFKKIVQVLLDRRSEWPRINQWVKKDNVRWVVKGTVNPPVKKNNPRWVVKEGIIRDDFTMEGYEILELMCELLAEQAFDCPYAMREAVCTFIWSASRMDIPELREVKKQLTKKYGQDFEAAAVRNMDGCVNERVTQKLSVQPPSALLVVNNMEEIAKEFKVNWEPDGTQEADLLAPIPAPTVPQSCEQAPQSSANPPYLPSVPSSSPSTEATATAPAALQASVSRRTVDNYTNEPTHFYSTQQTSKHQCGDVFTESVQTAQAPQKTWYSPPAAPASASNATESIPDFDELTARIERLRQRQDRHDPKNLSFTF
ncbi:hypothetical protein PsorP6_017575 [Peronosclerospora sorghi]|uniref:Uncharacterized protein n=1 Tax=Peronosclerospora sorghi TaxID=230839 RepID=A0ACC0WMY3_9STRA|nr:hypothetical protein PsorP6_017575 [Peronosclerospora sorghi]